MNKANLFETLRQNKKIIVTILCMSFLYHGHFLRAHVFSGNPLFVNNVDARLNPDNAVEKKHRYKGGIFFRVHQDTNRHKEKNNFTIKFNV